MASDGGGHRIWGERSGADDMLTRKVTIRWFLGLALLVVMAQVPVDAKSAYKEFYSAWSERSSGYEDEFVRQLDGANQKITVYQKALEESDPKTADYFRTAMDAAYATNVTRARGELMHELLERMKKKPSAAASELWIQERVSIVKEKALAAEQNKGRIEELLSKPEGISSADEFNNLVKNVQKAAEGYGYIYGMNAELDLIDQNLRSYYVARGQEKRARSQALSAFFGSIAQSFSQQNSYIEPSQTLTTRCSKFGWTTTCTTN